MKKTLNNHSLIGLFPSTQIYSSSKSWKTKLWNQSS